jgi:predicted DNA binding CopG/RHH family protein
MSPIGSRTIIRSLDDIPTFADEDEERAFWATHEVSDELAEAAEPIPADELPPPRPRSRTITLRIESDTLARLKSIAEYKGMGYQTLLKDFLVERLYEEEKRAGIV